MKIFEYNDRQDFGALGYNSTLRIEQDENDPGVVYVEVDATSHSWEENVLAVLMTREAVQTMIARLAEDFLDG